ncbi:uncharacterized protein Dana_GF20749 [Drosophila ananassae]|uniref:Uncharacterized protein n=1 Tax=Drosophila ananassae TaxID=7217 RepID=B3N1Q2_DROAN|nr:uncharacterized protein LOC6503441 [Drosophila ananassae]EDV34021.1 uncharacterized protein Dana_GF20749 [Drosophila ananassae]
MHSSSKQLALHLFLLFVGSCSPAKKPYQSNGTPVQSGLSLNRSKRVAIFNGSGTNKIVCGLAYPIKEADPVESLWGFINYQAQYVPSPIPIYWWSFWNTSTFVSTARTWQKDIKIQLRRDGTRIWLYDIIETGLERFGGKHGGACLLRSICEISQRPFQHNNMFGEILNAVLIPQIDNVPGKYLQARDAGNAGADCTKTYFDCTKKLWCKLTKMTKMSF